MKYDDLTLMKYADGELELDLRNEIEKEILDNEELKARLEVFTSTTANKIRLAQEYGRMLRQKNLNKPISTMAKGSAFDMPKQNDEIPAHIIEMIENYEPSLKDIARSKLNERKKKLKIRIGVISSIFAAVIAFSLMPQVATKGINFLNDSNASISFQNVSNKRLV
jgi:hypothetical protein